MVKKIPIPERAVSDVKAIHVTIALLEILNLALGRVATIAGRNFPNFRMWGCHLFIPVSADEVPKAAIATDAGLEAEKSRASQF